MTVTATELPEVERRGGAHPDLPATRPGEAMPEQGDPEFWDPPGEGGEPPRDRWECDIYGCGGD